MEKRKHPRFAIQCAISSSGDKIFEAGAVANLSMGSCGVARKTNVYNGMHLALHIYLPDQEDPLKVDQAAVRWAKDHEFGLEFISMRPEEQARLRHFVSTLETQLGH